MDLFALIGKYFNYMENSIDDVNKILWFNINDNSKWLIHTQKLSKVLHTNEKIITKKK